jgi:hypothetical protein
MTLPKEPVTLSVEQIGELNQKLSAVRHDVNNHLTKIIAAIEIMRLNPQSAERRWSELAEQPTKVAELVAQFSRELETTLCIRRP